MLSRLRRAVETLTPGYFALVMGSGIISVGMRLTGFELLSRALLVICAASFVVLVALTLWRFVSFLDVVRDDFVDPRRAFGFFTFIAGTNVLGVRLSMDGLHGVTAALLVLSGAVWDAPMVTATRGLLAGLAVVFWAFATWLIPVLFASWLLAAAAMVVHIIRTLALPSRRRHQ